MKRIAFFLLLPWLLFSQNIDTRLLEVEATLFEKILFLDYDIDKKLIQKSARLYVVYKTGSQKQIATMIAKFLDNRKFHNTPLKASAVSIGQLKRLPAPTAYISVLSQKEASQLSQIAIQNHRLLFAYHPKDIAYAMISLQIDARVVPVINPATLKRGNIQLRPIIFKVAKIYRELS
jgi:hypothetical protein